MPTYSEDWSSFRHRALERDAYRCRNCGSTLDLDVHHIVPLSRGGTNHLDNIITLCRRCHIGVEPHVAHLGMHHTGIGRTSTSTWLLATSMMLFITGGIFYTADFTRTISRILIVSGLIALMGTFGSAYFEGVSKRSRGSVDAVGSSPSATSLSCPKCGISLYSNESLIRHAKRTHEGDDDFQELFASYMLLDDWRWFE